jgi:hypothetical protein
MELMPDAGFRHHHRRPPLVPDASTVSFQPAGTAMRAPPASAAVLEDADDGFALVGVADAELEVDGAGVVGDGTALLGLATGGVCERVIHEMLAQDTPTARMMTAAARSQGRALERSSCSAGTNLGAGRSGPVSWSTRSLSRSDRRPSKSFIANLPW